MENKKAPTKRDIELLFEISAFRNMPRSWQRWLGTNVANNAEHSFRVAWTALLIAKHEQQPVDEGRIIKMALLHDLPESRCTDVDYIQRAYVKRDEMVAARDVFKDTALQKEAVALFKEFEERKTLESRITKDADSLDIDLELREISARGVTIMRKHAQRRKIVRDSMYTETAKKIWDAFQTANIDDWHTLSPKNRFNRGDYKRKK